MSIIRALLAAGLTLGLSTHAAATAEPTCSILDVSIADPESPSPLELRQVEAAARTAIAAQHVKHADAFPAQSEGVVGMMKGGGLKTVGYSKHGHANEPKTFPDCLDACYDDCKCLGFHWSGKHARCGLKADGNIPVLTDNRYQKTFRSFKRLTTKGCTLAGSAEKKGKAKADGTDGLPPAFVEKALPAGTSLPTVGATVTLAAVPDTGTLAYTVTLNTELDLSDDVATSEFKAAFSNDVSVVLAIDPDQVMITSLKPGSLVVSFALQMMTCGNGFQCSWVGDGWCDAQGAYNTAEHMYDGGDCCPDTCTLGSTAPFYAGLAPERSYVCGVGGYDCKRPGGTDVPQFFDYGFITTNVEPTTTPPTSTTSTTTEEPTTVTTSTTTSTTTAEPTTTVYCSYTNSTTTFEQGLNRYFADDAKECAINTFDTSAVTTMQHTFVNKKGFNQNINNWATSAVTNMGGTFSAAAAFNQNLNNWNTGTVTNMLATFSAAAAFNQNINNWNTSAVTTMRYMFQFAAAFNQNINNWATGAVTSMEEMFLNAAAFNQNINGIDTGAVTTMKGMFSRAVAFDQTITGWDVTKVTTVRVMFEGATLMSKAQRPIFAN